MKFNLKMLKAKGETLNQSDIDDFEKELQQRFMQLTKDKQLNIIVRKELMKLIEEILGESWNHERRRWSQNEEKKENLKMSRGRIIYISKGDLIPLCPYPKDDCELCPAMVDPNRILPPCREKNEKCKSKEEKWSRD